MLSLKANQVGSRLSVSFPGAIAEASGEAVLVKSEAILDIAGYLKKSPELDFDYLNHITCVDYFDYFELAYQVTSTRHNHSLVIKARCYDRGKPALPSVVSVWRGADFQEREIYDLMGIRFEGHPNLKRILLWEGFEGYPLRKDYL